MVYRNEKGFSGGELLVGALLVSIGISVITFIITWMQDTREARLQGRQQHVEAVSGLESGPEFGSFRITFDL